MRKNGVDHGHTRRTVGDVHTGGLPCKTASTNAEVLEEILQAAGLEELG